MRAPRSLRGRITLAALLALTLGGLAAGAVLLAAVERDGRRAVDEDLRERVGQVVGRGPGRDLGMGRGPQRRGGPEPLLAGAGTFVQVADGRQVVLQRGDVPDGAPPPPPRDGLATIEIDGEPWRSLTVTLVPGDNLRLQVLSSLEPLQERVASVRGLVIGLGLAALLLTGLAAWAFTSLAVRPLAHLQAGAARVSGAEDLSTPLPDREGPVEVRSLAGALNEMLARLQASTAALQRALEATRRFASDAGHELRTPLTGLRANLDALDRNPGLDEAQRRTLVRETIAEQERMVHLLEGLQALARGEAADSLPREDVEVADLVDAAVHGARRRHPATGFELDDRIAGARLHGWPDGLRLLVDNLLDNAALHGGAQVRVALDRDGAAVTLRVEDDGAGVAPAERERVLEPFARGKAATAPGTGLGLAIVAQQVALHGGTMALGESELGGLAVRARFPLAPSAARSTLAPQGAAH